MKPKPSEIYLSHRCNGKTVHWLHSGWKVDCKGKRIEKWFHHCGSREYMRIWKGHLDDLEYLIKVHEKLVARVSKYYTLRKNIDDRIISAGCLAHYKYDGMFGSVQFTLESVYGHIGTPTKCWYHSQNNHIPRPAVIVNFELGQRWIQLDEIVSASRSRLYKLNSIIANHVKSRLPKPVMVGILMQVRLSHGTLRFKSSGHTSPWWEICPDIDAVVDISQHELAKLPV